MSVENNIHELLPWFLNGTLEPDQADTFRGHLTTCDDCRREMTMLTSLQGQLEQHGPGFLEDHPSSEKIVAAARGDMSEEYAARVRSHLALCASCSEEAGWVSGEGAYGAAAPAAPQVIQRQSPLGWIAAIAAMLVVASIPLWRSDPDPAVTGIVEAHQVIPQQRGAEQRNLIPLREGQPYILLVVPVDLPEESFPLSVALIDADGLEIRREPGLTADSLFHGNKHYTCTRTDCPVGEYTLRFYGPDAEEPELTLSFEVFEP